MAQPMIAVIGGGAWGTVLAVLAARNGCPTRLVIRDAKRAVEMNASRHSPRLPDQVQFPEALIVTADASSAMDAAQVVILAVPAQEMRAAIDALRLPDSPQIVVSAAKGIELRTLCRMSTVIHESSNRPDLTVLALSGPNLAREIAEGKPAASVIAGDPDAAAVVMRALGSERFRLYAQPDLVGVELAGALKNVIAIAAGVSDGIGAGDNAKAALITRGLAEMARIGSASGASPMTFSGLAGLGDLYATCASPLSRNRRAGELLASGSSPAAIATTLGEVAEGMTTAFAARELAAGFGVDAPITNGVCRLIEGSVTPIDAMRELMTREQGFE